MRIVMIMAMISIVGCYTLNKALKGLKKANYKHPAVVAEFTRQLFPCINGKVDTIVKVDTTYEFIEIACPDVQNDIDTTIITKHNPIRFVTKKVLIPSKTIYITKKVEDSAKISILTAEIADLKANNAKLSESYATRKMWLYSFLKALIVSLLINAFLLYKKYGSFTKLR